MGLLSAAWPYISSQSHSVHIAVKVQATYLIQDGMWSCMTGNSCKLCSCLKRVIVSLHCGQAAIKCSDLRTRSAVLQAPSAVNGRAASEEIVVICGAGIIGAATAYYLAQKGIKATVVDRGGIACSSSGKAGTCCRLSVLILQIISSYRLPLQQHVMPANGLVSLSLQVRKSANDLYCRRLPSAGLARWLRNWAPVAEILPASPAIGQDPGD